MIMLRLQQQVEFIIGCVVTVIQAKGGAMAYCACISVSWLCNSYLYAGDIYNIMCYRSVYVYIASHMSYLNFLIFRMLFTDLGK